MLSLALPRLKKTAGFFFILAGLLAFNLLFNLFYDWSGITLIVQIYAYVFSFYLVFDFSLINLDEHEEKYRSTYGRAGENYLFLEARVLPLLIIYAVVLLAFLIQEIRSPHWPWSGVMGMLDGKNTNLLVYSLFLLFALKLKRDPFITIPLFLGLSVAYFYLDLLVGSISTGGGLIQAIMILKLVIFYFFLFYEFFARRNPFKLLGTALMVGVTSYALFLGSHMLLFDRSSEEGFVRREAGMYLLRLGFKYPVGELKEQVMRSGDPEYVKEFLSYARRYRVELRYSDEEWESLLFSGTIDTAEMIAAHLKQSPLPVGYAKIVDFAEKRSFLIGSHLENAPHFTRLAARYVKGNEADLERRMRTGNPRFARWGVSLAGESRSPLFIPFLLEHLTGTDTAMAQAAYDALTHITGLDPRETMNLKINDPEVVTVFKDFYVRMRTGR
jgi:hypothetical protein